MTAYLLSKLPAIKMVEILDYGASSSLGWRGLVAYFSSLLLEYPNLRTFAIIPGIIPTDMLPPAFAPLANDKGK
jgi:hypothetical protein